MYKITEEQEDFILDDIKKRGVLLEDLQENLLDHVCCIIENEMPINQNFYEFYESIIPRFFNKELKEIQEETDFLLTFKHYYAMKSTLKISGISSSILILIGGILKTLHLPGAGICIVLGGAMFALIFLPLMIALKFRDEESKVDKVVLSIGFFLGILISTGIMFKMMHWPGANVMMLSGLSSFVFGYVPLYFVTRYRRAEIRFNTIVNTALMMACGGMLYSLYNLGYSKKANERLYGSYDFVQHNKQILTESNSKLIQTKADDRSIVFHDASNGLNEKIENIKNNLISKVAGISLDEVESFDMSKIGHYESIHVVKKHFEDSEGELSSVDLINEINNYNKQIEELFPENIDRKIVVEKVQLKNTSLSFLLHNLFQIQLQVLSLENLLLNK